MAGGTTRGAGGAVSAVLQARCADAAFGNAVATLAGRFGAGAADAGVAANPARFTGRRAVLGRGRVVDRRPGATDKRWFRVRGGARSGDDATGGRCGHRRARPLANRLAPTPPFL